MKKVLLFCVFFAFLLSCKEVSEREEKIEEIAVSLKLARFEQVFFETAPQDLKKIKAAYPKFFPNTVSDSIWIDKMTNPLWRELYSEVQKKYSDFDSQKTEIETVFKHAKYYFPNTELPEVITVINEMDYNNKVIYTGDYLLIALELYLGKDHRFYQNEFPVYLRQNFETSQILPDIVDAVSANHIPNEVNKSLLALMISAGKELYVKDLLLPHYSDADKIGYASEEIEWCEANESYIWRYFIDESLLYDNDPKLAARFVNKAPFSKFYLEIDNDSPGQVGAWLGWQIVRAYAENNKVEVNQLLNTDAETLFNNSKYKPKK